VDVPEINAASPVASASLILTNLPTGGWCHLIEQRRKVIGRADDVDIAVPTRFRSVSRKHAEVWRDHRGCWIRDLGSRVGTRVNWVWIDRLSQAKIVAGDLINLGDRIEIQVVAGEPESDPSQDAIDEILGGSPNDDPTVGLSPRASRRQLIREHISPAETELLLWVSRGYLDNDELGRLLHRSPHTVRTQLGSILRKLGLHSRGDIIGWLRRPTHGDASPGGRA
jgi:DNA-binding CsgD family transcriptional regulator